MQASSLKIDGAFEFTPRTFPDDRGVFVSPYQEAAFVEAVGHPLKVAQTNHSVSRAGTIRGIHYADVPPSQAKYVFCPRGSLIDVVIDIRVGSPTFGQWDAVLLSEEKCNAVYLPEGLGHAMIALEDDTTLNYLCSTAYNPSGEHGLTPLDPALDLPWPRELEFLLSEKDKAAPTLAEAYEAGTLPRYEDCLALYASLKA
ncbi:dTDP-4-dehydrorhamnose 3,5-epimerase family protein [Lentzea nigeriaca]|uniref:dTDP-4-dehydrorhamnose 3,5-epimerase family protein n=1 Tax=Lentzea nigeriaca TaxID=1128665 RepID=UPI001956650F|nr:dTDP-4-dehydrorhamnose 3,5-epimerase [Lentzea nigeriaca]MBM7859368.1 dTDP-4-dehydrorhamnose 3,5-epimerase [Lentzea nigeriaca]